MSESGPITTWAQQSSALLNVSAEIRNRIYRDVLVFESRVPCVLRLLSPKMQPLHVCRQIRAEGEAIFWAENDFSAMAKDEGSIGIEECVQMIGSRRANMITRLWVGITFTDDFIQFHRESYLKRFGPARYTGGTTIFMIGLEENLSRELGAALTYGIPKTSIKIVNLEPPRGSPDMAEGMIATMHLAFNTKIRKILELDTVEKHGHAWKAVLEGAKYRFWIFGKEP